MIVAISHGTVNLGILKDAVAVPREGEYIRLSSSPGKYKVYRVTWLFSPGGETTVEVMVTKVLERSE